MKLLFRNSYDDDTNNAVVSAFVSDEGSPPVVFVFRINSKEIELSLAEAKIFRSLLSKEHQ